MHSDKEINLLTPSSQARNTDSSLKEEQIFQQKGTPGFHPPVEEQHTPFQSWYDWTFLKAGFLTNLVDLPGLQHCPFKAGPAIVWYQVIQGPALSRS